MSRSADRWLPIALQGALGLLWAWLALHQGGYFAEDFYPVAAALLGLMIVLLAAAPLPGRWRAPALVAMAALVALGAWTAASILWTPTPDSALADAHHALLYAVAFAIGFWLCLLLRPRFALALLPVAIAGAVAGLVTAGDILLGDRVADYLDGGETLDLPIGYRNGNAAFVLICFWATLALVATPSADWRLRATLAGSATLLLELAVLSQSRGSVLAFAAAIAVFLVASPLRLRALAHLFLVAAPAACALPWLLEVYAEGTTRRNAAPLLEDALVVALLGALAAVMLVAISSRLAEPRMPRLGALRPRIPRWLGAGAVGLLVTGALAGAVAEGSAVDWLDEQIEQAELKRGDPKLERAGSRFALTAQTDRYDFWRVSLLDFRDSPLLGEGAGSFEFSYLVERDSEKTPQDPHSVELLMLGELGILGLVLLAAFLVAALWGTLRTRRLGGDAAILAAGALAAGGYWLVHASIDWFWNYPALTLPVVGLVGAACAPALAGSAARRPPSVILPLIAATLVLLVSCVPVYLSAAWTDRAQRAWNADLEGAYTDLDRAADANPVAVEPLLVEGVIAERADDPGRASAAFREAVDRQSENWAAHYFLGKSLLDRDPRASLASLRVARILYPESIQVREAQARVRAALEKRSLRER